VHEHDAVHELNAVALAGGEHFFEVGGRDGAGFLADDVFAGLGARMTQGLRIAVGNGIYTASMPGKRADLRSFPRHAARLGKGPGFGIR